MACPEGGEHSLDHDHSNGTTMQICTKCGTVMDHSTFAENDTTGPGTSYAPMTQGQKADLSRKLHCNISGGDGYKRPSEGLTCGLSIIKDIGNLLRLSTVLIENACSFYTQVFYDVSYIKKELRNKKKIAACCLYIKCRQNSIPLTMRQICHMIQEEPRQFGHYYNDIVKHFGLIIPPFEFEKFIQTFCSNAQLGERITKRVEDMVSFVDMTGNKTGFSYQRIVAAMAFLAWQADDVTKNGRVTLKMDSDVSDLKVLKEFATSAVKKHVKLLLEDFKKLAAELPWLRGKKQTLTNYTVLYHIDDVLKYKRSLFSKHMQKCDEMEEQFRWEMSDETIPEKSLQETAPVGKMRVPDSPLVDVDHVLIRKLVAAAAGSEKQNSVSQRKFENNLGAMNKDLKWIGSMLNSKDKAELEKSWDSDSKTNYPSCKGKDENSNLTDSDTASVTDNNIDTPDVDDTNTDTLDNVRRNRHVYSAAIATIVDQTGEGDLILQLPAAKEFQTVELECGDRPQIVKVCSNVIDTCATWCNANTLRFGVDDSACGGGNTNTIEVETRQAALHSANLDRVKRKYSRCIGPRSFKRARILEAEKGPVREGPVETVVGADSSDDSEVDENIMSDSEVDQYLRSPQEITTLKALHEKGAIALAFEEEGKD